MCADKIHNHEPHASGAHHNPGASHASGALHASEVPHNPEALHASEAPHDLAAHQRKPGLIWSMLTNRCSHCRRGKLYLYKNPYDLKNFMKMPETCPVCGQPFEIEVGFWYGTGFVSYALSVIVCVASFIAWKILFGMSLHDNRLFWWIGVNGVLLVALQPVLMRLSRTIWLNFFVWYDPAWKEKEVITPERTNLGLKNDW